MAKTIFLIVLSTFLFNLNLSGQNADNFFSIGITPTYLFDPITPSLSISIEQKIAKKINAELMNGLSLLIEMPAKS